MIKSKRGQGELITTVLIMLVVLAAVAVVATFVIRNVQRGTETAENQTETQIFDLSVTAPEISLVSAEISGSDAIITVKRAGGQESSSIKVRARITDDAGAVQDYTTEKNLGILETRTYTIPLTISNPQKVEIYPIVNVSGREVMAALAGSKPFTGAVSIVNGACDALTVSAYWAFPEQPSNLCSSGTAGDLSENYTNYFWDCIGSALGGNNASCSANKIYGLVAYYPLDGNANDASGNNLNGELFGDTNCNSAGKIGTYACYFDGSGDYIEVADNNLFDFGTGDFTVAFWMKAPAQDGWNGTIGKTSRWEAGNKGWLLAQHRTELGNIRFDVTSPTPIKATITTGQNAFNDAWHYITAKRDSGSILLYIDNVNIKNGTGPEGVNNGAKLTIGRPANTNNYYFKGTMDEVRIYNRSLSNQEINALYSLA